MPDRSVGPDWLQVFSDVFQNSYQLIDAEPRQHTYLACALLMRGNITTGKLVGRFSGLRKNNTKLSAGTPCTTLGVQPLQAGGGRHLPTGWLAWRRQAALQGYAC